MIKNILIVILVIIGILQYTTDDPICEYENACSETTARDKISPAPQQASSETALHSNSETIKPSSSNTVPPTTNGTKTVENLLPEAAPETDINHSMQQLDLQKINIDLKKSEEQIDNYEEDSYARSSHAASKRSFWQSRINGSYSGFIRFYNLERVKKEYIILKLHFPSKGGRHRQNGTAQIYHYNQRILVRIEIAPKSSKLNKNNRLVIKLPPSTFERSNINFNSKHIKLTGRYYFKSRFYKGTIKSCNKDCLNVGNFKLKAI
jgi:hypothetical protein